MTTFVFYSLVCLFAYLVLPLAVTGADWPILMMAAGMDGPPALSKPITDLELLPCKSVDCFLLLFRTFRFPCVHLFSVVWTDVTVIIAEGQD